MSEINVGSCLRLSLSHHLIIIIISAVHATAARSPPQLAPYCSNLSHSNPMTATNFLDVVSPYPFGSASYPLSFSGCPFCCYLAHLVLLILATCPAHCPHMHRTLFIISFTPVLDLIISFRILFLFVMFNNDLSMLRWATASCFSCCFVRAHVSAP